MAEDTAASIKSTAPKIKTRDDEFYIDLITFEVEGFLFRVPRRPFKIESVVFEDMFTLPPTGGTSDGASDDNPLILHGIAAKDFRALLKALYKPVYGPQCDLSQAEWTSVLRLAHLWEFQNLYDVATQMLDESPITPVAKILLARKYNVTKWLKPAYLHLTMRAEPLTAEEVDSLGTDCAMKLVKIRESRYKWMMEGRCWNPPRRSLTYPAGEVDPEEIGLGPSVIPDRVDGQYVMRLKQMVNNNITELFDLQ